MLWSVLLFRLVCPVSFSSAFSLFNFFNAPVADSGGIEYISKGNGLTVVPQISSDAGYFGKTVSPVVTQAAETTSVNPMQDSYLSAPGFGLPYGCYVDIQRCFTTAQEKGFNGYSAERQCF